MAKKATPFYTYWIGTAGGRSHFCYTSYSSLAAAKRAAFRDFVVRFPVLYDGERVTVTVFKEPGMLSYDSAKVVYEASVRLPTIRRLTSGELLLFRKWDELPSDVEKALDSSYPGEK